MIRFSTLFAALFFVSIHSKAQTYEWAISLASTQNIDLHTIATDKDNDVLNAGTFPGTVDFDPTPNTVSLTSVGPYDSYLAKYSSMGALKWVKQFSGTGTSGIYAIKSDQQKNIILTGSYTGTVDFNPSGSTNNLTSTNNSVDIFIAKYDSLGNYLWAIGFGASNLDYGTSVDIDKDDNIFVSGNFTGTVDFNPLGTPTTLTASNTNSYFAKYTPNGLLQFVKHLDGNLGNNAQKLIISNQNNLYLVGDFLGSIDLDPSANTLIKTSNGGRDFYIAKYSLLGDLLWANSIGGLGDEYITTMGIDRNDNIIVGGVFSNTVDFDPGAGTQTMTVTNSPVFDIFIAKYDSLGNLIFVNAIAGNNDKYLTALEVLPSGNIVGTGTFTYSINCNTSGTPLNLTAAGSGTTDIFVVKYHNKGSLLWAFKQGNALDEESPRLAIDKQQSILLSGKYKFIMDFDPGPGVANQTSIGGFDVFIQKLSQCDANTEIYLSNGTYYSLAENSTFQWINCAGMTPVAGETGATFTPSVNGNYALIVTQGSCIDTSACISITNAGVTSVSNVKSVQVYPNPTSQLLNLFSNTDIITALRVTDIYGKELMAIPAESRNVSIDISGFSSGTYFITTILENHIQTTKIIKL